MALFSQSLFQMWEPLVSPVIRLWSLYFQSFTCFLFQSLAQGVFVSFSHLHQSFAPKNFLRVSRSWSPKPPWVLGLQSFSQATKAHFFFSSPLPQRKSLSMFLMCCKTPFGAGRAENMKMGRVCKTTFVSTSHPAKFKDFLVHFLILSRSLLVTGSQTSLLRGLSVRGIPRYLEGSWSLWKLRIMEISLNRNVNINFFILFYFILWGLPLNQHP